MKGFVEALSDGYKHIRDITDPHFLKKLREEQIKVDEEGLWEFTFGDHKEYDLRVEPIGEEGQYQIALYKNGILLTQKLPVWTKKEK